jgi:hypothetical protein
MTDRHATCPYRSLPDSAYWKRSVAQPAPADVNPALRGSFVLSARDKVATAGSCFAQNIARFLSRSAYNYFVTEPAPGILPPEHAATYNYGTFSARFGNIYTTRQLLQLFQRAYGLFTPQDEAWVHEDRLFDPFRPQIQPLGFASREEYEADRHHHLAMVRRMVEELDVFVFTLGLTEAWVSRIDGAVYPVCPGCGAGQFDPERVEFRNFEIEEVTADLQEALALLRNQNPACRIILTVSPVPLIATASGQHALPATTYSKSVLRVAAERVARGLSACDYFPSYEIITGAFTRGAYFGEDLRSVTTEGIEHVMRCFAEAYLAPATPRARVRRGAPPSAAARPAAPAAKAPAAAASKSSAAAIVSDLICDEEVLTR